MLKLFVLGVASMLAASSFALTDEEGPKKVLGCEISGISANGTRLENVKVESPSDWEIYITPDGQVLSTQAEVEAWHTRIQEDLKAEYPDASEEELEDLMFEKIDRTILLVPFGNGWENPAGEDTAIGLGLYAIYKERSKTDGPVPLGIAGTEKSKVLTIYSIYTAADEAQSLTPMMAVCRSLTVNGEKN